VTVGFKATPKRSVSTLSIMTPESTPRWQAHQEHRRGSVGLRSLFDWWHTPSRPRLVKSECENGAPFVRVRQSSTGPSDSESSHPPSTSCSNSSHLTRQPRSEADIFIAASSHILVQSRPKPCPKPRRRGPQFRVQYGCRPSPASRVTPEVRQCAEHLQCDACKQRKVRCDKGSPW
jgi:hypothetical protein